MAGRGLNKIMIIGNLGKDPEMKFTSGGKAVTSFSVAVGRTSHNADTGQSEEQTEWFRVITWEKLAETSNTYLRKGSKVYIEGRLQTRTYKDAGGQDQKIVEVIAQEMQMLDPRPSENGNGGGNGVPRREWDRQPVAAGAIEDDGIPF